MNVKGKKKKNQVVTTNIFEQQELLKKAEVIRKSLTASTWHELETHGKFDKNRKLSFISDDMLILGCDVGSEIHYTRAIDTRGRELSKSAFSFCNTLEGFQSVKEWALEIATVNEKKQIVLGLEPTGHYWFCLASWLVSNGIRVVQVNPYAVKQTKEIEDNSQLTLIDVLRLSSCASVAIMVNLNSPSPSKVFILSLMKHLNSALF